MAVEGLFNQSVDHIEPGNFLSFSEKGIEVLNQLKLRTTNLQEFKPEL